MLMIYKTTIRQSSRRSVRADDSGKIEYAIVVRTDDVSPLLHVGSSNVEPSANAGVRDDLRTEFRYKYSEKSELQNVQCPVFQS
jgi:hypothetical protein